MSRNIDMRMYADIKAPAAFAACISAGARKAVAHSPRRMTHRACTVLIAIVLLMVSGTAVAAFGGWFAGDLFTEETGYMLPAYEWGQSSEMPRESTISFYGHTAEVSYQFVQDRLRAVDIVLNRANLPQEANMAEELLHQIISDMNASYRGVPVEETIDMEIRNDLQAALREELGITQAESEWNAESSAATSRWSWIDEKTDTAIALTVGYTGNTGEIRVITVSLAQLSGQ